MPYRLCFVGRPLPVVRGKTDEYGRFVASGKTLSCRFSFVGRPLPVLQGKTGEYGRFMTGGKTLSYRFSSVGRPLTTGGENGAVQLLFSRQPAHNFLLVNKSCKVSGNVSSPRFGSSVIPVF